MRELLLENMRSVTQTLTLDNTTPLEDDIRAELILSPVSSVATTCHLNMNKH